MCPFEVVYGLRLITPLDLLPLPLQECTNMEASKRAEYVKSIHMKTKQEIEKKSKYYAAKANKNPKKMIFAHGDLIWYIFGRIDFQRNENQSCCPVEMVHSKSLQR